MSKSAITTTDTGTTNEPAALTDKELDAATGGSSPVLLEACVKEEHLQSGHEKWIEVQSMSW
jgi:hypothetical protein